MGLRRVGRKTVDVLVNGVQQASYTQDQDRRDYDVSVSENSTTFETATNGRAETPSYGYVELIGGYAGSSPWSQSEVGRPDRFRIQTDASTGGDHSVTVELADGSTLISNQQTGAYDSGYLDLDSPIDYIEVGEESGNSGKLYWKMHFEYTESPGYSIDGVTQS